MRAGTRDVLVQDRPPVPRPGNAHLVGDLGPDRAHPVLGASVRSRAARRDRRYLDPGIGMYRAGCPSELPCNQLRLCRPPALRPA
jgi:hypothetical protein